jgi:hypothetical protein
MPNAWEQRQSQRQSLRHPKRRHDGRKYHSHWNQTFGYGIGMYSRHRTSKRAKPCSMMIHTARELPKIAFGWEIAF